MRQMTSTCEYLPVFIENVCFWHFKKWYVHHEKDWLSGCQVWGSLRPSHCHWLTPVVMRCQGGMNDSVVNPKQQIINKGSTYHTGFQMVLPIAGWLTVTISGVSVPCWCTLRLPNFCPSISRVEWFLGHCKHIFVLNQWMEKNERRKYILLVTHSSNRTK